MLSQVSSPYEVMAHSPYSNRLFDKILDPNWKPINPAARGVDYAIDNVAMRRHLREFFPDFSAIVQVRDLDRDMLIATIDRLSQTKE